MRRSIFVPLFLRREYLSWYLIFKKNNFFTTALIGWVSQGLRLSILILLGFLSLIGQNEVFAASDVGLYDVWEKQVTNSKSYSNPFDYTVIELRATFTSPTGSKTNFFGYHDGNGKGGQNGNVWKLRFMPNKTGTWKYSYTWTDGTSGGSGSFKVVDTGLPGPLKVASDNAWYFMDSRNQPFHFRGYGIHGINYDNSFVSTRTGASIIDEEVRINKVIDQDLAGDGYNFTLLRLAGDRKKVRPDAWGNRSFWINTSDKKRFDIPVWHTWERIMARLASKKVYAIPFATMIAQKSEYSFTEFKVFLRYFVARFGGYYNFLGWGPTSEWHDIWSWSGSDVHEIMSQAQTWDPFPRLLTVHDCSLNSFSSWLDFSMRQSPSRDVFTGNSRQAFWNQFENRKPFCGQSGIGSKFVNKPIVGSEDQWETPGGQNKNPRNAKEVRRGAWGSIMAGIMPLYSEWNIWIGGTGKGGPDFRRMLDFVYSKTQYRKYKQLNSLVSKSKRQIASGKEKLEYLVYDENGGSITINLGGAGSSNFFDALWFDPTSGSTKGGGTVKGGASRTLQSPYSGDTVLLLTQGTSDNKAPAVPRGLTIK